MAVELFILGLISLLGQVVLMRELIVSFFGVELIYVLAMGTWLLGSACGAAVGRRTVVPSASAVKGLFLVFTFVLPALVAFCRGLRPIFSAVPGAYLPFGRQMLAMGLALLPAALVAGLIFQWAARRYAVGGKTLAGAYALESAGGMVGGAAATGLLALGLENSTVASLCALAAAATAIFPAPEGEKNRVLSAAAAVGAAALLAAVAAGDRLDRATTVWSQPEAVASADTPYGRITITEASGRLALFENGALVYETESVAAEAFVHLAALQHPAPEKVLLIGGGVSGHLFEIRKHHPKQIDLVEINPGLLRQVRPLLPVGYTDSLTAEEVTVVSKDPRSFLKQAGQYDLILVAAPEPLSGQSNRFYTREFFRSCARRLAPDGVLAFQIAAAENLWPRPLVFRNASVYRALSDVFDDVLVLPGTASTYIGAERALERRPEPLVLRLERRRIDARLVSSAFIRYQLTNDRTRQIAALLAAAEAPANTDRRPICYPYSMMVWLSQFFPERINREVAGVSGFRLWPALAAAVLLFFLLRSTRRPRRLLLAFCAGLLGMIFETVLILQYQMKSGVLYQDIGVLLTAFMAGLAAGAAALEKAAAGRQALSRLRPGLGRAAAGGFSAAGILAAAGIAGGLLSGLVATGLLLFTGGFLISALFAFAALDGVADPRAAVSSLLAADLLGGCFGTVAASFLLIPFFGMDYTAAMAGLLAAAAMVLI